MSEHPIQQPISGIDVFLAGDSLHFYKVGRQEVTHIEACTKRGLHCNIPYVRVWAGDHCVAEFCQPNIISVYFAKVEQAA